MNLRQELLNKALLEVTDILDKLDTMDYFLCDGTVLGIIRGGELIKYDADVDIGIITSIDGFELRKLIVNEYQKIGLNRDIHVKGPCREGSYSLIIKSITKVNIRYFHIVDNKTRCYKGKTYPNYLFDNLKEIEFLNKKFKIPNPPEEYLELMYGKNWELRGKRYPVVLGSDPPEIYYRSKSPTHEKALLKCDDEGKLNEPLERCG